MVADDNGRVSFTMKDVYDALQQLSGEVKVLQGELRVINANYQAGVVRMDDYENRLRSLEKWKSAIPATIFGTLTTAIFSAVAYFVK